MTGSLLLLVLACVPADAAPRTGDKRVEQVKQLCEQFIKAVAAKDLDGVMKLVDVPWYENLNKSQKGAITNDREQVREFFKKIPEGKPPADLLVKEVLTYKELIQKAGADLEDRERNLLEQVVKKDGY